LPNLTIRADEYHGPDQIRIENGQGLPISHTGLSSLSTPTCVFKLSQLLHVPQIQKTLISINKFTHDKQVFVEFHPFFFFCVKDLYTGTLLLKGPSKDGLYPFPTSPSLRSSPIAFVGERVSLHQWHSRLGHPASHVVQRILSRTGLPIASTKQSFVCPTCQQGKLQVTFWFKFLYFQASS